MKKFTEWLNVREANAELFTPGSDPKRDKEIQTAYYDMAASAGAISPEMKDIYQQNMGNKTLITRLNNINKMVQSGQLKPAPGVAAATSAPGAAPAQEPDPRQAELLRQRVAAQQQMKKGPEQVGAARMRQGGF